MGRCGAELAAASGRSRPRAAQGFEKWAFGVSEGPKAEEAFCILLTKDTRRSESSCSLLEIYHQVVKVGSLFWSTYSGIAGHPLCIPALLNSNDHHLEQKNITWNFS